MSLLGIKLTFINIYYKYNSNSFNYNYISFKVMAINTEKQHFITSRI